MKEFKRQIILCLSVLLFLSQIIPIPEVNAVESWSGDSWEGNSWEGTPWDAGDLQWEGVPWEGDSWEGDPIKVDGIDSDNETTESDESQVDGDEINEEEQEVYCLPGVGGTGNGSCDEIRDTLDLSTEEKLDDAVNQFVKDHPNMFLPDTPWNKDLREKQIENIKQEFTRLLERPHGSVQEVDIPDNVMATLAESGYSDEHLGSSKEDKDNFLEANNWIEIDKSSDGYEGLDARTFNHTEDDTIVISFGGTEKNSTFDLADIFTDANLALGYEVEQFKRAVEYVNEIMEANPGKKFVLTGHSLGGGIAQYVSINTGIPAITYSAPGIVTRDHGFFENPLSIISADGNLLPVEKYFNEYGLLNNLVENHIMEDDIVGNYQIHAGTTYSYSTDGTVICRDDYGEDAHKNDSLKSKYDQFIRNKDNNFSDHSMKRYFDIMVEC